MAMVKPAGTWTYDDLLALPDDGRRYEIIEGELYEMPVPTWARRGRLGSETNIRTVMCDFNRRSTGRPRSRSRG